MKQLVFFLLGICFIFVTAGCQNTKTRVVEGSVIGGLVGGAAGGVIGHQSHHGGEGAAIGVAAGALTGALIGSQIDKPKTEDTSAQAVSTASTGSMTMQKVVDLTKEGVADNEIIDMMKRTNSKFKLSSDDVKFLMDQGVSMKVINAMQPQ
ncbi:MAG: glycine zipper 2TM domain-containing protein [Candidatus Omnitrophota bacterium]